MLSEMDEDLDRAAEKMGLVLGKVAKLLKTKDKCQIWGVILLFFTLIILVALVIYTEYKCDQEGPVHTRVFNTTPLY